VNTRLKLFIIGFLLCIALGVAVFCAIQTVQAFQRFQQDRSMALSGDVRTIRPWMTLPFISHVYHVPESYLDEQLHITDPQSLRRASLHTLAARYKSPEDKFIQEVQQAILNYRKQHPTRTPSPASTKHTKHSPLSRRKPA
jgi:hypothetical protein